MSKHRSMIDSMKPYSMIEEELEHNHKAQFVRDNISLVARYLMLAEEAAEVSQAAAKIARIFEGTNPTPKTTDEAFADLSEEMNDVYLAYEIATGKQFKPERNFFKLDRCVTRICEADDISYKPLAD